MMLRASTPTVNGSRYLQQLCKHWSHKFEVTFDAKTGRIDLPFGPVTLDAGDDALRVTIELSDPATAEQARKVVAEHLDRFAFREAPLAFDWQGQED